MLTIERHGVWSITAFRSRPLSDIPCTAIARKEVAGKCCTYYVAEGMTEQEAIEAVRRICDKAEADDIHSTD